MKPRPLSANSRFWRTPLMESELGTVFGTWVPPRIGSIRCAEYQIQKQEENRPDLISFNNYGSVEYWWFILLFNGIADGFGLRAGDRIAIPDRGEMLRIIEAFRASRGRTPEIKIQEPVSYPRVRIQPFPEFLNETLEVQIPPVPSSVLLNIGFEIPDISSGPIHFQLQLSSQEDFSQIEFSKFTLSNTTRWSYFNGDGFVPFPSTGVLTPEFSGNTVYFSITTDDGLEGEYYVRWRYWESGSLESIWFAPPPVVI